MMQPPLGQGIMQVTLIDPSRRSREQKSAQPDSRFPVFFLVLDQQRISARTEQIFFGSEMCIDGIKQIIPDDGKVADKIPPLIRHAFNGLFAEAQQHLVLIIEDPIPDAIAGLPLRKILLTHDQPRSID
jgi:hypothetical protein